MAGTFAVTVNQSNGHIGVGDGFTLENAGLSNTSKLALGLAGLATATLNVNSARFLDFAPAGPGAVGGVVVTPTDVYLEVTAIVTGLLNTTLQTKIWANSLLPFTLSISTSAAESGIATAVLGGTFGYQIGVTDISLTLTLDLIVSIEGTAHVVPDPALGGLTALGLGGAGAWLRRRRS
jgi:MYXO-CTERM domain-containing protein